MCTSAVPGSHVRSSNPANANWRPLPEAAAGIGLPKSRWSLVGVRRVRVAFRKRWPFCLRSHPCRQHRKKHTQARATCVCSMRTFFSGAFQVYSSNKTLWVDCTRPTDALVGLQGLCSSTSPFVKGLEVCLAPDLWPCIPPCALNPNTQTPKPSTLNPKPWPW